MVIRQRQQSSAPSEAVSAWRAVADAQHCGQCAGYVSQPAHAALAGQLAAGLLPDIFGDLPPEVLDAIARHDLGWAETDLTALEADQPESFLEAPPNVSVCAWRRSIHRAQDHSQLAAILTSRHFLLLTPKDGDPHHERFSDCQRRYAASAGVGFSAEGLDRFTAALGFCDLLSLYLCSGCTRPVTIPLAHPADEAARDAERVTVSLAGDEIRCSRTILRTGRFCVNAWLRNDRGLTAQRLEWIA
jgi:hypothetical protein